MKRLRATTFALMACILIPLSGCDGGLSCPIDRPACCDNVLFGCGLYDLPQGCTCSSFLFSPRSYGLAATRMTSAGTFGGSHRISLNQVASSCKGLLKSVTGTIGIREQAGHVTVTTVGLGTLRGTSTSRSLKANGIYRPLLSGCSVAVKASMQSPNATRVVSGTVQADISVQCTNETGNCSASYSGKSSRLR